MNTTIVELPAATTGTGGELVGLLPEGFDRSVHAREAEPHATSLTGEVAIIDKVQVSDEALLLEISCGDEWALEVLYQRYARYAYTLAYRIVHNSPTAEDVVQDSFLSIWNKAASYQKHQGCVRSWLQAIVHHRAVDCIRAAAHRDYHPLEEVGEAGYNEDKPEVWEEVWNEERRTLVQRLLTQLPEEQRLVIELGYFGGYTHAEIARRWHLPLGTVKGRMRLGPICPRKRDLW